MYSNSNQNNSNLIFDDLHDISIIEDQFSWTGYIVWMVDSWIPKVQFFYGDLTKAGFSRSYRSSWNPILKHVTLLLTPNWDKQALNWSEGCQIYYTGVNFFGCIHTNFEDCLIQVKTLSARTVKRTSQTHLQYWIWSGDGEIQFVRSDVSGHVSRYFVGKS